MSTVELLPPKTAAPTYVPVPDYVGPWLNGMEMTPEEYDAIEDGERGYRYELINGVFIVTPPAGIGERNPNDHLGHWILAYKEAHAQGAVVDATAPDQEIRCGKNRRRADRAIWLGLGRLPKPLEDVPAIAVEFVGKSARDRRRDYVEKRREYAEAGVQEYWVIDRFEKQLTVFRGAKTELVVGIGDTYEPPLMPGFALPVGAIIEMANRWGDD